MKEAFMRASNEDDTTEVTLLLFDDRCQASEVGGVCLKIAQHPKVRMGG